MKKNVKKFKFFLMLVKKSLNQKVIKTEIIILFR